MLPIGFIKTRGDDMKLTDTFAKRKQGNGKTQKHADGGGLFLYITPNGSKSWRLGFANK